jgi:hypothetical protein
LYIQLRKSKTHSFYLVVYLSTEVVLDLEGSLLVSKQEFQAWKNSGFKKEKIKPFVILKCTARYLKKPLTCRNVKKTW